MNSGRVAAMSLENQILTRVEFTWSFDPTTRKIWIVDVEMERASLDGPTPELARVLDNGLPQREDFDEPYE